MLAAQGRLIRWLGWARPQQQVETPNEPLAVAVEKPVIPGPAKAFGQDVLQQQPEKVGAREGSCLDGAAVLRVAERNLTVFAGQDVLWVRLF